MEAVVGGSVVEGSVVGSVVLIVSGGPGVLMDSVITVNDINQISIILFDITQYALNNNFTVEDC